MLFFRSQVEKNHTNLEDLLARSREELQAAVIDLTSEISDLKGKLEIKEARIEHLEKLLRSGEIYADGDTGLLNRKYYEEYVWPVLDNSITTITFIIKRFDGRPRSLKYRRDLARAIIQFCSAGHDTAILWESNVIKMFLKIPQAKMEYVRESITALLQQYIDISTGTLEFTFRNVEQDPDLGKIYWKS